MATLRAETDSTGRTIHGRWITVDEEDGCVRPVQQEAPMKER